MHLFVFSAVSCIARASSVGARGGSSTQQDPDTCSLLQTRVGPSHIELDDGDREAADLETCLSDTGKRCGPLSDLFQPCPARLGPTECVDKKCQCLPGVCVNKHGQCVSPVKEVLANVYPGVVGPKVKYGICLGGGGNRALSYSIGALRALAGLGVLQKFEALTAVSGGSWMASLYMFAPGTDDELLGPATNAKELNLDALEIMHSSIGQRAVDAKMSYLLWEVLQQAPGHKLWQNFIGHSYLEPFGLNDRGAYLAASQEDAERIKKSNPKLQNASFITPRQDRPGVFVIMGTLLAPPGYSANNNNTAGFEMSPGYIGIPGLPNNGVFSYDPILSSDQRKPIQNRPVGGGMLESFSFTGASPESKGEANGGPEIVGAALQPFTLADAIGISSMAPAGQLADIPAIGAALNPRANYWPAGDFETEALEFEFGDGGNADISGLISLLLRGAERVFWISPASKPLNRSYHWDEACSGKVEFDGVASGLEDDLLDKFGLGLEVSSPGWYWANNQVFDQAALLPLGCKIWEKVSNNKPAIVSFTERVLPNTWWGVEGDYSVSVELLYLETTSMFTDQLPTETQEEIGKGDQGAFANFPFFPATMQNEGEIIAYTASQINLLAAQGEYSVLQAKDQITAAFP